MSWTLDRTLLTGIDTVALNLHKTKQQSRTIIELHTPSEKYLITNYNVKGMQFSIFNFPNEMTVDLDVNVMPLEVHFSLG